MGGEGIFSGSSVIYNQPRPEPEIRLEYENGMEERVVLSIENTDEDSLKQMLLSFHLALKDVLGANNGE